MLACKGPLCLSSIAHSKAIARHIKSLSTPPPPTFVGSASLILPRRAPSLTVVGEDGENNGLLGILAALGQEATEEHGENKGERASHGRGVFNKQGKWTVVEPSRVRGGSSSQTGHQAVNTERSTLPQYQCAFLAPA